MSVFGDFIHAGEVEQAVKETLQRWFETYLCEMERQTGRTCGQLPLPRSYQIVSESDDPARWPEDQLPSIIILAPGFAEPPTHDGYGAYRVRYQVSVAAMVSANTQGATRQLSRLYGTTVAAILTQNASLGDFASGITWTGESFDDIPLDTSRSVACAIENFQVDVDGVLTIGISADGTGGGGIGGGGGAGPTGPVEPGTGDCSPVSWGTVQQVNVDVETFEED